MKHDDKHYSHTRMSGLLLGLVLLSLPCTHAVADDMKDKQERLAQFRMQQMKQKFEEDKAVLEQENATLKEQLKKAEARLAKQRQETNNFQAENSQKEALLLSCQRDAEIAQQKLEQSEMFNKQLTDEKSRLETALAKQNNEVQACQKKNTSLISLFKEMASKYEKAELKNVEPFTGLSGVEIENHFQDSVDQAENQLYQPRK